MRGDWMDGILVLNNRGELIEREGIKIDWKIRDALGRLAEGNLDHGG